MTNIILTAPNLKLLKDQIRDAYKIPSAHLSEAIAAALGFGSNAALNAHMKSQTGEPTSLPLSDDLLVARLRALGSEVHEWRGFSTFSSATVESDGEPKVVFKKSGPFRMVYNFWLAPNFDRVLAGKTKPPFVNHDLVDFEYLRSVIADEFRFGSPVEIRLANDTIDQVTLLYRNNAPVGLIKCQDFAKLLLKEAKKQSSTIIDIRGQWAPIHHLKDRRHAPPAVLVPIVVEAYDAEDAFMWSQQVRMRLGVRAAHAEKFLNPTAPHREDDQQGYLTDRLHKALATCFNTPYKPYCLFDWAASDPLPPDYRDLAAMIGD